MEQEEMREVQDENKKERVLRVYDMTSWMLVNESHTTWVSMAHTAFPGTQYAGSIPSLIRERSLRKVLV